MLPDSYPVSGGGEVGREVNQLASRREAHGVSHDSDKLHLRSEVLEVSQLHY